MAQCETDVGADAPSHHRKREIHKQFQLFKSS